MPLACTLLFTFAALGVVFVFVLVACAWDGFAAVRSWLRFSRSIKRLDAILLAAIQRAHVDASDASQEIREQVTSLDEVPRTGRCERNDCPYKARCGET